MAGWDSVPWFVGGGAQHTPEVARVMAYMAFRGNEGILAAGDLRVRELSVPGGKVRIAPGACSILCRSAGQQHQAYAGRLPVEDQVDVAPTDSSGGRSDLVIARVEDPWLAGEPWPDPADPTVGPYIFSRVIPDVPPTTTKLSQLGLGYSGIALARLDIPASTATITQAMVKDLRTVANPRRERRLIVSSPAANDDLTQAAFRDWPAAAVKTVDVPAWATQAKIITTVAGALATADLVDGFLRNRFGGSFGQDTRFDTNGVVSNNQLDKTMMTADTLSVPSSYRGTTQQVALQGRLTLRGTSGNGLVRAYYATTVVTDVEFLEVPD